MTDKEKIRAEIERMMSEEKTFFEDNCKHGNAESSSSAVVYTRLQMLLKRIDSIPEEPVSDDLEEAAKQCAERRSYLSLRKGELVETYNLSAKESFIDGANWQKKQLIDKACEWLEDHADEFQDSYDPVYNSDELVEAFRKAMETRRGDNTKH